MLRRSPSNLVAQFGVATLVAGTVAGIAAGCLTDPDRCTILLSRNTPGGTLGFLTAPVANRGPADTTFTITSTNAADVSTVNWLAIPKNPGGAATTTFVNNASLRRSPSGLQVVTGYTTLVAGTKTVTGIPMKAGAKIFVMAANVGGTTGKLSVPVATVDVVAGTFVINSSSATDTSTVGYVVVSEAPRFSPSGPIFAQAKGALTAGAASFAGMDPSSVNVDQANALLVIASVITPGTPGNLACPWGSSTRTGGAVGITSTTAETSLIELAAF